MKAGMNVIRCNMSHGDHEERLICQVAAPWWSHGGAMVGPMAGAEHEAGELGEGLRVGSRVQGQDEGELDAARMCLGDMK